MKAIKTITAILFSLSITALTLNTGYAAEISAAKTAQLDKKGQLIIKGSEFAPNTLVTLLFTTKDGVQSDIGYALKPAPKADAQGNWSTTWSYGRFVKKKLVAAGDYQLTATDDDFNTLSSTLITFSK